MVGMFCSSLYSLCVKCILNTTNRRHVYYSFINILTCINDDLVDENDMIMFVAKVEVRIWHD